MINRKRVHSTKGKNTWKKCEAQNPDVRLMLKYYTFYGRTETFDIQNTLNFLCNENYS